MLRLKVARLLRGISQRDAADAARVTRATLCYIESGRVNPNADELKRLSKVLGVPADRLMDHVDETPVLQPGAEYRDEAAND